MLADLVAGLGFVRELTRALRRPFDLPRAEAILRRRLATREDGFLALARRAIYGHPPSPYRRLLRAAGCDYADLARLVAAEGVEGALAELCRHGVYLAVDEFKGRRPVVRSGVSMTIEPRALFVPGVAGHVRVQTSGSRGAGSAVPIDLACVRDHAVNTHLTLAAAGGAAWRHAHWGVPGGAALVNLIEFALGGTPPARWFSQLDPAGARLHPRYRWSARGLRWGGRLAGVAFPAPEPAPPEDPAPILRWMAATLRAGAVPHLWTYASAAVRVCEAAWAAGVELAGAQFTAGGEPSTAARLAVVHRVGPRAWPRYGSTETDIIAAACHRPAAPDDMHLLHDRRAVVQPGTAAGPGLRPDTLLFSSVLASDPVMLLNVSLGDRATLGPRRCGCPLAALGWSTHLQDVRSDEKLTAGGMNFLDVDVVRVLEEVLPARFGGGPLHYQLVEDEGPGGEPRLTLLVDPAVGPVDEPRVAGTFLDALAAGPGAAGVMAAQWRAAGLVRVARAASRPTRSGKVLHVHHRPGEGAPRPGPPAAV